MAVIGRDEFNCDDPTQLAAGLSIYLSWRGSGEGAVSESAREHRNMLQIAYP